MGEEEEIKKEIEEIKKSEQQPNVEEVNLKIILSKNTHKKSKKTFTQYKMNLPKEIMESITSENKNYPEIKGVFDSYKNKLTIEIWSQQEKEY